MGSKDVVVVVTDPLGFTHYVLFDKDGVWGYENLLHFLPGPKDGHSQIMNRLIGEIRESPEKGESILGLTWVKEMV